MRGRIRQGREREGTAYRMATAERLDIEKGKDLVALEELEGRDVAYIVEGVVSDTLHPSSTGIKSFVSS